MKIGVLSGQRLPGLPKPVETITVETPYGDVSMDRIMLKNQTVFFVQRHGSSANLPPHKVNYHANIHALASAHVDGIIAVATVGSLNKKIKPGDIVIPHDFIDATKQRNYTFYDNQRVHVDMTDPYCHSLRNLLITTGKQHHSLTIHDKAVYLATEGPRLETAAEIRFYSTAADVVGMTGVPEVILAREKGLCYTALCVVVNMATGLQHSLTADEITHVYKQHEPALSTLIQDTIEHYESKKPCTTCAQDLTKATL